MGTLDSILDDIDRDDTFNAEIFDDDFTIDLDVDVSSDFDMELETEGWE